MRNSGKNPPPRRPTSRPDVEALEVVAAAMLVILQNHGYRKQHLIKAIADLIDSGPPPPNLIRAVRELAGVE